MRINKTDRQMTMPKMLLDLHQASMHGTTAIWNKYIPIVSLMRAKTNVFPGTLFNKVVNIFFATVCYTKIR